MKHMAKKLRWVTGVHACQEALRTHPQDVKEIYFADLATAKTGEWQDLLKRVRAKPGAKSSGFFKDLSEFGHQNVALATEHWPSWPAPGEVSTVAFLDGLEDPHNLGAIVRTSWLMSVDGLYISEKNSVKITPTVCKVASGGCEHIPVTETHFLSEMKQLKEQGYWVYGFSDKAQKSIYDIQFPARTVLVFGSEEKGIRIPVLNECDEILSIPQAAVGASYNVSVSVGIALSEVNRQLRFQNSSRTSTEKSKN